MQHEHNCSIGWLNGRPSASLSFHVMPANVMTIHVRPIGDEYTRKVYNIIFYRYMFQILRLRYLKLLSVVLYRFAQNEGNILLSQNFWTTGR